MGCGSYTSSDWAKLKDSRKISEHSNDRDIFKKTKMDPKFDPKYINVREAWDNPDHPESTPIILGLDVTGSMGYLAAEIAKNGLNETMMKLFSTKPVSDPQIMFAAMGDVVDDAPLQVTQFESDIRIAEQLMDLWLEGRGGDSPEDYPLLWYFAAKHTVTDCFRKRGKKGYIFTIGDAESHKTISAQDIKRVFSDSGKMYTIEELAEMASEKYELFHIHITSHSNSVPQNIGSALPGRVMRISPRNIELIPEVIVSALLMHSGKTMDEVLKNWDEKFRPTIAESLSDLKLEDKSGSISF
ncbi:hypothetical protein [uncultured Ruminococcus sp.]|uniref:hypothetical protein n=1 Tax=uncultured Ruminococcus sp. TaxID=165186 RepID=UPI0025EE4F6F|nr:hypothetical protein [uncultured Ruminococcus sp.]